MTNDIALIDKGFSVAGFNAVIYYKGNSVEYQVFFPNGYGAAVTPGARVALNAIVHGRGWWEYYKGEYDHTPEVKWIDSPEELSESLRYLASLPPFERNQIEN